MGRFGYTATTNYNINNESIQSPKNWRDALRSKQHDESEEELVTTTTTVMHESNKARQIVDNTLRSNENNDKGEEEETLETTNDIHNSQLYVLDMKRH